MSEALAMRLVLDPVKVAEGRPPPPEQEKEADDGEQPLQQRRFDLRLVLENLIDHEPEFHQFVDLSLAQDTRRVGVVGWRLTLLGGVGGERALCLPPSLLPRHGSTRGCQS